MLDEGGQSKIKRNRRLLYSLKLKKFISGENDFGWDTFTCGVKVTRKRYERSCSVSWLLINHYKIVLECVEFRLFIII